MVLILGGVGAGKGAYVRSLGFTDAQLSEDAFDACPVFVHLDRVLRRGEDAPLEALLKKEFVLCAEVGSGVIPLERADRAYREAVGRLCVQLAKEATAVVRVVAGIPVAIKGELPCKSR